jgi:DNA-binding beta-propeller fold protein YncE
LKLTPRLAAAVIALFSFFACAGAAQADRGVVGSFGASQTGDGEIAAPAGVDVYAATGDVYVSDAAKARVQRYDADGNFELAWGWGVADGAEEFQICTSDCQAGVPGSAAGQLSEPRAIAVDQSDGSVYVFDYGSGRIDKFDKDGNFLRAFGWGVLDGAGELQACTTSCQAGSVGAGAG